MTEPIPDESLRRRTWLIAGVLGVAVVLVGVGVAFGVMALRPQSSKPVTAAVIPSGAEGTSSVATSAATTASANSTSPASSTTASASTQTTVTTTTPPGQIVRAARIAYRLGGKIWVAAEDGSDAKMIVKDASDEFSLSPDGKTLVLQQGSLALGLSALLIDVASGVQAPIRAPAGANVADLPTWAPDSSWLAYTSGTSSTGYSIRRVNTDGSLDSPLITHGAAPSIAPDGKHVAFTKFLQPSIANTGPVQVYDVAAGTTSSVPRSAGATYFAYAAGGVLFFVAGGSSPWLGMANRGLSASSVVASIPAEPNAVPGPLLPSPDGSKVLFGMFGDTGFSRLRVADVSAGTVKSITARRDETPVSWLLDGSAFFYVDGNAQQLQHVALYRMAPDGLHTTLVVDGAGL